MNKCQRNTFDESQFKFMIEIINIKVYPKKRGVV